ncbi:Zn(II)2Cys6 transcription factor domain-containing protein [Aspergillus saccharolyticus JOP 1030-1]|uniref:Zn(2)-C6 fungal-type domain-containing protein n=1 Tax=Aspergillus saccharolyticus JOP 1030-1 TaxID=1450539 RepID=A0A318ZPM9_9EURO|nr:hypothetical protein BP01DRAFT_31397 [Aspergillus saccharolyticus JOP 1030-1]PYH45880.1 hypothetical protein BP01DRAFT_31397 [Aspergillus saccharolyticus JOP 1030-1]
MSDSSIAPAKRQRAYTKRSKSGCRTCRLRRIKCDEFPGACKRCTSTGRQCDGYELCKASHKPLYSTVASTPRFSAPGILAALTPEERRGFGFFQQCTVPTLAGFYDSILWEQLSLQIGHAEPAVCHAAIALSAVHCCVHARRRESVIPRARTESRQWQQFAFEQLGRSFQQLQKRHKSQDPQFTVTVLLCCLLFVASEFTLGNYANAFRHLRSGLNILRDQQTRVVSRSDVPLEPSLVQTFMHLDAQAACFGFDGPILAQDDATLDDPGFSLEQRNSIYWTVAALRQNLETIAGAVVRFCRWQTTRPYDDTAAKRMNRLLCCLTRFLQVITNIGHRPGRVLTQKEHRGLKLLTLEAHALRNALLAIPLSAGRLQFHEFTDDFEVMLSLVTEIQQGEESSPEHLPQISLDIGVIPPLYSIARRAGDSGQRWRAIRLLQSYPHQEGPWNANALAQFSIESMPTEEWSVAEGVENALGHVVAAAVQRHSSIGSTSYESCVTNTLDQCCIPRPFGSRECRSNDQLM